MSRIVKPSKRPSHRTLAEYDEAPEAAEVRDAWPPCELCHGTAEHPAPAGSEDAAVGRARACNTFPEGCFGNFFGRMHPEQHAAFMEVPSRCIPYPFGP